MDSAPQRRPSYAPEIIVGIGYAVFFLLLTAACMVAFVSLARSSARARPTVPTYAPLITPTARIRATLSADDPGIFLDDFSSNKNRWDGDYWNTKDAHVQNGKLVIENKDNDSYAVATCGGCLNPIRPYYLQADLSTNVATDEDFGIMIRTRYWSQDFYLYQITPESHAYSLYHRGDDGWKMRASGVSDLIHSFPSTNTLGIYANGAQLEFYVNGQAVDTYEETGIEFESGVIGFYSQGTGYQLEIDNLMIKGIGD